MAAHRNRSIVRAPLFDRLVDDGPDPHSQNLRVLTRPQLLASIRREVLDLLNTRVSLPPGELAGRERSILDYGIADLGFFIPGNPDSKADLEAMIADTIMAFEPRLLDVQVTVLAFSGVNRSTDVRIDAVLAVGALREPVSFDIATGDPEDDDAAKAVEVAPVPELVS